MLSVAEEYRPAEPAEVAERAERLEGVRSRVRGERSRRRRWASAPRTEPSTESHNEPRLRDTQVVVGGTVVWTGARHAWRGGVPPIR